MLGTLYIISAPSGGGKTSLVNALINTVANLEVSVSFTTRPMRPGETPGKNYHFVSTEDFNQLITERTLLEYARVFDHYYGTSRQWVEAKLQAGIDVILEIDWQGARQIRQMLPSAVSIFILPPSWSVLNARLQERAQDDVTVIARRMEKACAEISHYDEYDYLVVNDEFAHAVTDLSAIVQAHRLQQAAQKIRYAALLDSLLKFS